MLLKNGFYGGGDAILQAATETAPQPSASSAYSGPPSPALPAPFTRPRFVQTSDWEDDNGASEVYGLGSRRPQIVVPSGQKYRQGIAWSVLAGATLDPLLAKCKPISSDGTLPSICLLTGATSGSGENIEGVIKAQRFAKCDSLEVTMAANTPVTAKAFFWYMAEETQGAMPGGAVTTPFAPSMTVAPFDWGDVQEINVRGVNVRHMVDRLTLKVEYYLERSGWRPDYNSTTFGNIITPWSLTTLFLKEGNFRFRAQLQFQTPEPLVYIAQNGENASARTLEIVMQKKERPTERLTFWSQKGTRGMLGKGVTTASPHVSRLSFVLLDLDFAVP